MGSLFLLGLLIDVCGKANYPRQIENFPRVGPITRDAIRRKKVARTPYALLYRVENDRILVVRIRHDREDWRGE